MKKQILNAAQSQMGSAHLEAESIGGLFKSFFKKLLQWVAMTRFPVGSRFRVNVERLRGVRIGKGVFLGGGNVLDRAKPELITLEEGVSLAGGVFILTHSNPTEGIRRILGEAGTKIAPVHIGKHAWIAVNVVILPGVTIGECAIVAAGSVVTKDVPPYTLVGGAPARVIRELPREAAEVHK